MTFFSRYQRANSEDTTGTTARLKVRSILKRKNEPVVVGGRFRCYSESNVDDFGWSSGTSLGSGLSTTTIAEEGGEEGGSVKKTVRFSEKVHQQLYRFDKFLAQNLPEQLG